ncbi:MULTISPECIES: BREX-1 system adenine-specific DNA-methyltransferase PglX [Pseudomonas]|mgnify:FL=1|uniref:site-specific DNA-methyltransferase (adenine-specific) n=2 Tax=Pseudomonas proteolytica TaxID=219574 RepID=A0AAW5A6N7_9PSED|nr:MULTISPECIES: BREX-1 system adenine-specific DNA-methyltransferase PglX [Pseudomonas]MBJ2206057.1 BREX-1 system adenine-specific DNA-methyltransferase PglX [Pseudomonas carnis]MCF5056336.1 BREX-1 system adenine-specific DNA-methyltransferase PglX [Pseudomonas proteolytica]MCP9734153.1 BREX-1 system adenine-specific DNA-methyltransferase PglX [Pseudomonas sp. GBPI_506]
MNTSSIKNYAPKARTAFIAAMTKRAALFGIRESSIPSMGIAPVEQKGDLALIGERAFPASIIRPRAALVKKVEQLGFAQAMEQAAYSWFNRLCAIRYMELKDYLGHGRRVLSAANGNATAPQILDDCLDIELPGLDKQRIAELKLDGTKDEELYRELLLAQCHALHQAMPFLFETVDDATELLLPDNLTKTDSLIRELVSAIPEEDWANIEIIGWLYQFYISEKKEQVIGKVVKSEDIPAATQLFTPNWIVKYMVQNSLGAQWLATYPGSPLKSQMEYYIEPVEQTNEVNEQLAASTPSQLNPETLTLIDPASGSGHILVEAYDLFKAIYLERGYRQRDVAQLILEKNLFGLDIDGRAAQLTGFALMMKGRADDRRLFERRVKLNVMALEVSAGLDAEVLASGIKLADYGLQLGDLMGLSRLFEYATTFGSLIQVPEGLAEKLPRLKQLCEATSQDLFVAEQLKRLGPLVQQAEMLAAQYDVVVANPPYMGSKYHVAAVKEFLKEHYADVKSDLFSAFIVQCSALGSATARIGIMSPNVWMYIASHEKLRHFLLSRRTLASLVELPLSAFKGATVQICSFTFRNTHSSNAKGGFVSLVDFKGGDPEMAAFTRQAIQSPECGWFFKIDQDEFKKIPGSPVTYSLGEKVRDAFVRLPRIGQFGDTRAGLQTDDNARFLKLWFEVSHHLIGFGMMSREDASQSGKKWFPHKKGGDFRKWYGNDEFVVNWESDGRELFEFISSRHSSPTKRIQSLGKYFSSGVTWTHTTSSHFSARDMPNGFIFNVEAPSLFGVDREIYLPFLCSRVCLFLMSLTNPTFHFVSSSVASLPFPQESAAKQKPVLRQIYSGCVGYAELDWNAYERSWDFQSLPILTASSEPTPTLESSYSAWITQNRDTITEMQRLEEENNRLFIDAYGLADELTPDVPIEQITLTVNPAYRYGGKMSEAELWTRFREDTCAELVSYAIGCMFGRYSLDEPGLIYAHSGNQGFDLSRYTTFSADSDGILPLTDKEWFADDAGNRLIEFVSVAWDKVHLEANLRFLAENLSPKKTESSRDTLRRYLCDNFFKDHLQTYKKRPIYWLFSSGKQKAFQCLVYLHRYNEGTLARMRTEYVIPLTAKLNTYANKLEQDIEASPSTAEKKRLEKELATLHNQQAELTTFDEKLRHHADQRISLDLDDGVKVNYGKFGDLLAEVKAITGEKAE